uniref:Angiotensin-converting enzyme n=1 Tax=Cacopsylla melanoneura TaxID=428564 RepID=A0A8D8R5L9_9HEMI
MACLVRSRPLFRPVRRLTCLTSMLVFTLLLQLHTSSGQFLNSQGDDRYIDPNQYITKQNSHVQERLRADLARNRGQTRGSTGRTDLQGAAQTFDVGQDYDEPPVRTRQRNGGTVRQADVDYQDISGRNGGFPVDRSGFARAFNPNSAVFNNQLGPRISQRELEIERVLAQIDEASTAQCAANVHAQWDFETNVNEVTQLKALEQQVQYSDFQRKVHDIVNQINPDVIQNERTWRQLRYLATIGPTALPPDQLDRYNRLINDMLAIFNSATICAHEEPLRCNLRLDSDIVGLMAKSRDWDELEHTWIEWRRRTGGKVRDLYEQLIELSNYAANLNNLTDFGQYWQFGYESPFFRQEMEDVWEQVRPLYEQLHAYVRRKLRDMYGPEKISKEAPLPAHILGDMWAQSWSNILDITMPYPGKSFLDVTPEMIRQGYTPEAMFRVAEDFFISLNMSGMPPDFWLKSIFLDPQDRNVICQPSAWDFCDGVDYRIKMCTQVNMKDFITIHHEMAHIQYFMKYRQQPKVFRDGANPAFHEAISEAITLSVGTPRHMQTLGLVLKSIDDVPHNINYLFSLAMEKVAFLPFALSLDMWRWDMFRGSVTKDRYNCHWWDIRERIGGVKPPVLRSEVDFDPGSKYHVPANIPYIGYFVSNILQFQIHEALCKASGQYKPDDPSSKSLFKCDIYRSKEAGVLLSHMMQYGSSVPWNEALFTATGESRLDAKSLREYFRPLEEWLLAENLRTGEFVGWIYDGDYCKYSIQTANLQVSGGYYNTATSMFSYLNYVTLLIAALITLAHSYR